MGWFSKDKAPAAFETKQTSQDKTGVKHGDRPQVVPIDAGGRIQEGAKKVSQAEQALQEGRKMIDEGISHYRSQVDKLGPEVDEAVKEMNDVRGKISGLNKEMEALQPHLTHMTSGQRSELEGLREKAKAQVQRVTTTAAQVQAPVPIAVRR